MLQLSVVIATYNRRDSLLRLLRDLAKQDLPSRSFEVIVVDDGSASPVASAVEGAGLPYPHRVIRQANSGQATARDTGISSASCDLVVLVDDDMELPQHFLSAHLRMHERGHHVVLGRMLPPPDLQKLPLFERFHAEQIELMVAAFRRGITPQGAKLFTGNVSLRRQDYLAVGGFDRSLKQAEDRDLGIRLENHGAKFAFCEDAFSIHHSDHTLLENWLRRSYRYGIYDSRIAAKYPHRGSIDPWHFLRHANLVAKPVFAIAAALPGVGNLLARGAMQLATQLDAKGYTKAAIRGTTLAYGIEYFRGVREEAGSLRGSVRGLQAYLRKTAA